MNRRKFLKLFGGLLAMLPFVKQIAHQQPEQLGRADNRTLTTVSLDDNGDNLYITNISDGVVWRSNDGGSIWWVAE